MKNIFISLFFALLVVPVYGQTKSSSLERARQAFQNKRYAQAANLFYAMAKSPKTSAEDRLAAQYYLGLSFMQQGFFQTASFPLVIVSRDAGPALSQKAFQKLVVISGKLNDSVLLDFALKKLDATNISELGKELYYLRRGQMLISSGSTAEALGSLQKALEITPDSDEALYSISLAYLKKNEPKSALPYLSRLVDKYSSLKSTDVKRGLAAMALARAYYQDKQWDNAVRVYREIPKDSPSYREAQMELSWALFRSAKFRSAMSTIQTLHTPFYENFYNPESLILRTIVLVFACQPEEAEKSLSAYQKNYATLSTVLSDIQKSQTKPEFYFKQIEEAQKHLKSLRVGRESRYGGEVPFFVVRAAMEKASLKNKLSYLQKVQSERDLIKKNLNKKDDVPVRQYALKILNVRIAKVSQEAGEVLRDMLPATVQELSVLNGDASLLKYEVLGSKKRQARTKYIKSVNKENSEHVDGKTSRAFYIQNGYRYWPFEGEYWRDELGNYHYLGVNYCENE